MHLISSGLGHENVSTAILNLPLIQEGHFFWGGGGGGGGGGGCVGRKWVHSTVKLGTRVILMTTYTTSFNEELWNIQH